MRLLARVMALLVLTAVPAFADPLQTQTGGSATITLPALAGNVVVKNSPGRLGRVLVTTTGTAGTVFCYDNATTNSGTIIAAVPGASAIGATFDFSMPAANGIVCVNSATGPVVTISYY